MGLWKKTKAYIKKQRENYRSVSVHDIIAMTLANNNKITAGALSTHTVLNSMQAQQKLTMMMGKGILKAEYDTSHGNSTYYSVKDPELFKNLTGTSPQTFPQKTTKKALTDAEVIAAAVKAKGRLIPGVLCVNAEISIDQAKEKLQELQHKGVFDIEVTQAGGLIYLLNDFETYQQLMGNDTAEEKQEE